MKYNPHDYQKYATDFVLEHPVAAIFLDCGMGKSVITLTAIYELLYNSFEVRKVLVIAPLRVARDTWPAEIEKWDHLNGLTYSVVIGTEPERKEALRKSAGIYLINRENVDWLINKSGFPFDFDMVVIDELSSFKSASAKRFKSLLKVRPKVKRIVGLTGTPSSNGLMDLWAEFRILDMGERLGRYITHYRMNFFVPDKRNQQMIFSYKPRPGAEDAIYRLISDITISMKSADFLKMPECIMNEVEVKLSEKEWSVYDELRQEMVVSLEDEEIDAANAAALSGKLLQMTNGAIYNEEKSVFHIHDRKLDALEDLIEGANGVTGKPPVPLQTKNKRKRGTSCENSSFFVFRISTRPASLLARLFHLGNPLFAFFRKLLRPWKQVLQKIQIRIVHVFRNLGQ